MSKQSEFATLQKIDSELWNIFSQANIESERYKYEATRNKVNEYCSLLKKFKNNYNDNDLIKALHYYNPEYLRKTFDRKSAENRIWKEKHKKNMQLVPVQKPKPPKVITQVKEVAVRGIKRDPFDNVAFQDEIENEIRRLRGIIYQNEKASADTGNYTLDKSNRSKIINLYNSGIKDMVNYFKNEYKKLQKVLVDDIKYLKSLGLFSKEKDRAKLKVSDTKNEIIKLISLAETFEKKLVEHAKIDLIWPYDRVNEELGKMNKIIHGIHLSSIKKEIESVGTELEKNLNRWNEYRKEIKSM